MTKEEQRKRTNMDGIDEDEEYDEEEDDDEDEGNDNGVT